MCDIRGRKGDFNTSELVLERVNKCIQHQQIGIYIHKEFVWVKVYNTDEIMNIFKMDENIFYETNRFQSSSKAFGKHYFFSFWWALIHEFEKESLRAKSTRIADM